MPVFGELVELSDVARHLEEGVKARALARPAYRPLKTGALRRFIKHSNPEFAASTPVPPVQ